MLDAVRRKKNSSERKLNFQSFWSSTLPVRKERRRKSLKKYSDNIEKEKLRKTDELGFALVCEEEKLVILFKLAQ